MLFLLLVNGCGTVPEGQAAREGVAGVGAETPELIVASFFSDLAAALEDPALADPEVRRRRAAELASYFAPNEREDQRDALNAAFLGLSAGRAQLAEGLELTLKLNFNSQQIRTLGDGGDQALVQMIDASLVRTVTRTTDGGTFIEDEQIVPLDRLIGRPDGAVPVVRIGDRWFLTEG